MSCLRSGLALAAIVLASCDGGSGGPDLHKLSAHLIFDPPALDFGRVKPGAGASLATNLVASGDVPILVHGLRLPPAFTVSATIAGTDQHVLDATSNFAIPPNGVIAFRITYRPAAEGDQKATIGVDTDDGAVSLDVKGTGYVRRVPELVAEPSLLNFGTVPVGTPARAMAYLHNTGLATGTVTLVQLASPAFAVDARFPLVVVPGAKLPLELVFTPFSEGLVQDVLQFKVTGGAEPDVPPAQLPVEGSGSPPLGELACTPVPVDFGSVLAGADTAHHVTCTAARGSVRVTGVELAGDAGFRLTSVFHMTDLVAGQMLDLPLAFDGAGRPISRRATLVVHVIGGSGASEVHVPLLASVIPIEPISAVLRWDTDATDLDVHLVRPGGHLFGDDGSDCYFQNASPNWGNGAGQGPVLDRDITDGYGPETITFEKPAVGATYLVYVHFFADLHHVNQTTGTLEIRTNGRSIGLVAHSLHCRQMWRAGAITWDGHAATFVPSDALETVTEGQCPSAN